jgi:hypothetical protein
MSLVHDSFNHESFGDTFTRTFQRNLDLSNSLTESSQVLRMNIRAKKSVPKKTTKPNKSR